MFFFGAVCDGSVENRLGYSTNPNLNTYRHTMWAAREKSGMRNLLIFIYKNKAFTELERKIENTENK